MKKAKETRLITATEIARHLYCARALFYDWQYPQERDRSLLVVSRRWLLSGWKPAFIFLFVLWLIWLIGLGYALAALAGGLLFLLISYLIWQRWCNPPYVVIYHGTKARRHHKQLNAPQFGLTGKLDYLLEKDQIVIPVLTKASSAPDQPHQAHIMQAIAHCLLLAENRDSHPPYAVIRYSDSRTFEVDFDEDSVEVLSLIMDEIEANKKQKDVSISHQDRRRCYACQHRQRCDQSLFR